MSQFAKKYYTKEICFIKFNSLGKRLKMERFACIKKVEKLEKNITTWNECHFNQNYWN